MSRRRRNPRHGESGPPAEFYPPSRRNRVIQSASSGDGPPIANERGGGRRSTARCVRALTSAERRRSTDTTGYDLAAFGNSAGSAGVGVESAANSRDPFAIGIVARYEADLCTLCGTYILDRYVLRVNNQSWHPECLRCGLCSLALEQYPSCFVRDDHVYCKPCYNRYEIQCLLELYLL
uniref:LIM zinc-binding domain-containing protein n=1 Tax=Plectus sambesii TaxID=2011161 RepID=A0A914WF22_9BILA